MKSLIMENGKISLGRVSYWLAFLPSLYIWVYLGKDIQPNHLMLIMTLLAYNFGKKGVDAYTSIKNGSSTVESK